MTEPAGPDLPDLPDLEAVGERIEALLTASSAHGQMARERSEELVRLVVDLYGAGLERILDLLHEAGRLDDAALAALAGDELVASLLLVHGLHPLGVTDRVQQALEQVRPFLATHGGDVELVGVDAEGTVQVRLLGSCDGCASSDVTLTTAVRQAVAAAAPEISSIDVVDREPPAAAGVIPISALRSRLEAEPAVVAAATPHPAPGPCPAPGAVSA